MIKCFGCGCFVSTHSRAKAAANFAKFPKYRKNGFNTQPREGGCQGIFLHDSKEKVSTHSRAKAAADIAAFLITYSNVSTHSRAKAAACQSGSVKFCKILFQHTAARRRLLNNANNTNMPFLFQHTAARRRLLFFTIKVRQHSQVSTHSRAKAAAWLTFNI